MFNEMQLPQVDRMAIKIDKVCKTGGLQSVRVMYNMVFQDGELSPHGLSFVWIKQDWALITVFEFARIFLFLIVVLGHSIDTKVLKQIFCPQENLPAGQGKQIH